MYHNKQHRITTDFFNSPLFRTSVGFDSLIEQLAGAGVNGPTYPPYNITRKGDQYAVTMAVAGFGTDDISVTVEKRELKITGKLKTREVEDSNETETEEFIHRGIAERQFERSFRLAEHVTVTGANLKNGLLTVTLQHNIPEAEKPVQIQISQ